MVMRTIQPSFAAGELAPSLWGRIDLAKYHIGAKTMKNFFVHPHGGASNRAGTLLVGETQSSGQARLVPFQFNVLQAYVLEFTHLKMRIVKDGGLVVYPAGHAQAGQVVEVTTPYVAADLARLTYVQSADVMYLTHPSYAPRKLSRTDHHEWSVDAVTFLPSAQAPTGLTGTYSGTTTTRDIKYVVSAVVAGEESLPSGSVTVAGPTRSNWVNGESVSLNWTTVPNADHYRVYKDSAGFYGWVGDADGTEFRDDNIDPDASDGPQTAENPFDATDKYPAAATFFEQRFFLGGTNTAPNTFWASRSGNFENLGVSRPLKDDDSIEARIASRQMNDIRHFVPLGDLVVFTSGAEWRASSGSNSDAMTPTSLQVKLQSQYGCSHVPPLAIGDTVLFVQRTGDGVRDLMYTLERDGYTGNDLGILSNHLFRGRTIIDWAYQRSPDSIVWCVRDDGALLGFTYLREHEVWAWHRHETDGEYESVCTIPGADKDETYFVVKRTIDGQTKRFIEYMADRLPADAIEDAHFVDCGLVYEGSPATTFSGLDHLEGKQVAILADGKVHPPQTVASGQIVLTYAASKVHVGLPYVSDLETLGVEVETSTGTAQGKKKRISRVTVRLENTVGMKLGPNAEKLDEVVFRTTEPYGAPLRLFTGDKDRAISGGWRKDGTVFIRQADPLPITVLAVIPEVSIA